MPPPPGRVRVGIANDYPIVVRGLASIVEAHHERLQLVELDVGVPPIDVADVVLYDDFASTQELGAYIECAGTKVVLFSANTGWTTVHSALAAGAAGYVFKGVSEERLVSSLERVHAGDRVVELAVDGGRKPARGSWPGREHDLTPRESEILALICQGLTNQQVAETLFLSVNSVKTYIRSLYRKIGAERRSQAVLFGIDNGFVAPAAVGAPVRVLPSDSTTG